MFSFLTLKFYAFSGLVNFITALVLAIIVLYKNPKVPINRIFSLFSFSVAFWSLFYFIWLTTTDKGQAEFYLRTCMIGVLFMPSLFIHFVDNLLQIKRNKKFYIFNYTLSIILTLTVYTPLYAYDIGPHLAFPYWLHPGPAFHLAISHFGIIVIYSFILMGKAIIKTEGIIKNQILYVFIGTAIGYIAGSTNYSCWYRLPIPPFLNIFVSVYVGFVAYAIAKYNLMGIDVAIKNFLARLFSLACLAIFVVGCIFVLGRFFTLTSPLLISLIAVGLSVLFYPFSKRIEWWSSQTIRPRPDFQSILRDYTEVDMMAAHTSKGLADLVVRRITDSLRPTVCSLMFLDKATGLYNVIASLGKDEEIKTIAFKPTNHLISSLRNSHQTRLIVKDELNKIFPQEQADLIRRDLEILRSQISIPLILHGELLGLLNLGTKTSGELYTPEEIGFLFVFLTQSAFMMRFLDKIHSLHELEIRAEKLAGMTNLLDGLNHEFRNQINIVKFYIDNVDKPDLQEELRNYRKIALQSFENMLMILDSVYNYRSTSEDKTVSLSDIKETINSALIELKAKFASISAKITTNIPQDLPKIETYPSFKYLFSNILRNSYYALAQRKTRLLNIKICQSKDSQRPIEIVITDTGGDMAKAMKEETFSSGGEYFPERANVGGINYFLAKHIIEDHKGKLLVSTNSAVGPDGQKGTIFTIRLPLTQRKTR